MVATFMLYIQKGAAEMTLSTVIPIPHQPSSVVYDYVKFSEIVKALKMKSFFLFFLSTAPTAANSLTVSQ